MTDFNHIYIGKLVKLAQTGDSDSFAELYALTYQHIYNYAGHYLRDPHLAQDAMQETYVNALKNIRKIKEPTLFVAWLNQICFRVCFDMANRRNIGHASDVTLSDILSDENPDYNPENQYEISYEKAELENAVSSLPFHEYQVIVMRYYNDMKLEEIAAALNCSRSSVKRWLASGIKKLSELLGGGDSNEK